MTDIPNDESQGMLLVEAVEALKSSWSTGESSIGSIGSQLRGATRLPSLLQLVMIDSELAIKAGQNCNVDQYVKLFPDLEPHRSNIEQHIREVRLRNNPTDNNTSSGLFSKASLDRTIDHVSNANPKTSLSSDLVSTDLAKKDFPVSIGGYRILRELGRGSFGTVLLAQDSRLNRDVAIKIQDKEQGNVGLSDAFLHEARAISRLEHPNIVRLLHVDETANGLGYLVYEYVAGATLADRVKLANYSIAEAVGWIAAIAKALDFAHRRGVVHRDISPRNIMIDKEGTPKLLDFGLSRLDDGFHVPDDNRLLGTPSFMSPEQASGKPHWATAFADIFSLGSVLYHALSGKLPFQGNSVFDICERVQSSTPPPLRSLRNDISSELESVVFKAMSKEPQSRYSTGADFAISLEQAVAVQKQTSSIESSTDQRRYVMQAIALVLLCVGIGLLASAWKTYTPPPHVSELTTAHVKVVRGGKNVGDLLGENNESLLPLKLDDSFSLEWTSTEAVNQEIVLILGKEKEDRKVLYPPSQPKLLQRDSLFEDASLVIVCLSNQKIPEAKLLDLPTPWISSASQSKNTIYATVHGAQEKFQKKLSQDTDLRDSKGLPSNATIEAPTNETIELSDDFKRQLIGLGVISYFGVVLDRQ
ncbi:MAG: serine/threonine-protein kinase [Pirellulaceae bacterium]|nr:serine/threonine-protein kinase [Pirellulaceae bacterium]